MNTTSLFNQNNSSSEFRPSQKLSDLDVESQIRTENDLNLTDLPRLNLTSTSKSARSRLEDLKEQRLLAQIGEIYDDYG